MSSNLSKIRKNGVFLVSDIPLDCFETIRAVEGEERDRNGLAFIVPRNEARITNHWRGDRESQTDHFHVVSLYNGLRFLFLGSCWSFSMIMV